MNAPLATAASLLTGSVDLAAAVPGGLTVRSAIAALGAFAAALVLGPFAIRWLKGRFREPIKSASATLNALHAAKHGTPTMGGLFVVAATVIATLLCGELSNSHVRIGLAAVVSFAALGAVDDWVKLRSSRRGLSGRQKFVVQTLLGVGLASWLLTTRAGPAVAQAGAVELLSGPMWVLWGTIVIVGSSNGVNLTDGLDGLAAGSVVFAGTAVAALTYVAGHSEFAAYLGVPYVAGCGELTVLLGGVVGSVLGFLWYNAYPAKVFLGDTGSLPLGAILGVAALAARQELLLIIIGGVFVVETLSVILQVGCYKLTGRRVLACSPLHNHFIFRGQHEVTVVTRFWIIAALLAIAGLAAMKL
ncbi:MAG: phospho-N-acetylmuramoyl-pentapeptide-transferase [Planctomycetaceae bacterium]